MKLLAYVPLLTPRIKYIFNFIFHDVLKTDISFSSTLEEFKASTLPKLSYASSPVADELHFKNVDLLLGHKIAKTTFKTTAFGDTIVPFAISGGALPFDVFAAAFYFLSRYEEYIHYVPDDDGHFPAELSLQSRLKLLEIPVIDAWALIIKNLLLKKYPRLFFGNKKFAFIPITCMFPGSASSTPLTQVALKFMRRFSGIIGKKEAPDGQKNEALSFVQQMHEQYNIKGLLFYQSLKDQDGEADGQAILPGSYLQLLKAGINNDFRMGYKKTIGFRAGTCTPFQWYDLQLEKTTHLMVHPIAINDASLNAEALHHPERVLQNWKNMVDTVKLLEGNFYSLWHEDTLQQSKKGKYARKLYQEMLSNFLTLPHDLRFK